MPKKLTQKEICQAFGGLRKTTVNSWVKRGNMIADENKFIDITTPHNAAWIDVQRGKGKVFDLNYSDTLPPPAVVDVVEKNQIAQHIPPPVQSDFIQRKQALELEKLEEATKRLKLQNDKVEGATVPVDAVDNILKFAASQMFEKYKQKTEGLLEIFKQRFEIGHKEYVKILKNLHEFNLEIYNEYVFSFESQLKNEIEKYSEVRGRGERK